MSGAERYDAVNDGRIFPAINAAEAKRAWRLLAREFGKPKDAAPRHDPLNPDGSVQPRPLVKTGSFEWWTNGNGYRRVWVSPKATTGHHKGWGRLIHDASHMVHRYRNPKARSHEGDHHRLELEVLQFVHASGWLDGKLKPRVLPKRTAAERRADRYGKLAARRVRWESKLRRAQVAIKKINRQMKALERARTRASAVPLEAAYE